MDLVTVHGVCGIRRQGKWDEIMKDKEVDEIKVFEVFLQYNRKDESGLRVRKENNNNL